MGNREVEALTEVILKDGYLGMGTQVASFEEEIASFLGVPRDWVICVSSGTAELQLSVQAVAKLELHCSIIDLTLYI